MKFRIHFESKDGTNDSVEVTSESLEEIRDAANAELLKRNAKDAWSEELQP